jgi:hypothetical protein
MGFRCPFPSCGREFNVNSNMRRHFRSHTPANFRSNSGPPVSFEDSIGQKYDITQPQHVSPTPRHSSLSPSGYSWQSPSTCPTDPYSDTHTNSDHPLDCSIFKSQSVSDLGFAPNAAASCEILSRNSTLPRDNTSNENTDISTGSTRGAAKESYADSESDYCVGNASATNESESDEYRMTPLFLTC